jgi:hypothetical protein
VLPVGNIAVLGMKMVVFSVVVREDVAVTAVLLGMYV